jgi:regulator of PEP synthase PpsR (kinase-PPPase family)
MQYGIHAANYPLTEEDFQREHIPPVLARLRAKLFGLSIAPERLSQIRQERRPNTRYASLAQCRTEVEHCESLYRTEAIAFVDTTTLSIEEIAANVIHHFGLRRARL